MNTSPNISALVEGIRRLFVRSEHQAVTRIMQNWPGTLCSSTKPLPRNLPVTQFLQEAKRNAPKETASLVHELSKQAPRLSWNQTYTSDDLDRMFLDRYGWTAMLGSSGYVDSEILLSGFLLLGPDVEYPVHRHSAEEIYVVLSGEATWKVGDADWQPKPAGSIIHNPPWQRHGMRTVREQPLLIGYLWNAGLIEKSQLLS